MRAPLLLTALIVVAGCGGASRSAARNDEHPPVLARASSGSNAPTAPRPALIPNTDVADTPENRDIIEFCERYRTALEARDADALLQLASPRYHEDGGTPDPADDIDYVGLEAHLRGTFKKVEEIRSDLRYLAVRDDGRRIVVSVIQSSTYKIEGNYRRSVSDNELVLERDGGSYRISSGM